MSARTAPKAMRRNGKRAFVALTGATLLTVALPAVAFADPPKALPASFAEQDGKWQPAFDYDGDGCYSSPAIGPDGTIAPGLNNSGALNGNCHDKSDLDNTNSYSRSKCSGDWCAYMYDLYFEKDQVVAGADAFGHRHDLEHVVIWVNQDQVKYVSTSAHGGFSTKPSSDVAFEGTHAKVVYHKDGGSTHCFRLASKDEQPENDYQKWQYPALVSWDNYPSGIRDKLVAADFGHATFGLKDDQFSGDLGKAKPSDIPFDPNA